VQDKVDQDFYDAGIEELRNLISHQPMLPTGGSEKAANPIAIKRKLPPKKAASSNAPAVNSKELKAALETIQTLED